MPEEIFALAVIGIIFVAAPATFFHYITLWRKQKTLRPDDEKIMEDLWHSAKRMERRIEALEALIESEGRRPASRRPDDTDYRRDS